MKGQFFISGIVVIAVILIVSMNYANSAEELRIELGNDLAFDNYKNAYERAVPDDWTLTEYVSRNKVGVCVNDADETSYVNSNVSITVTTNCRTDIDADITIGVSPTGVETCNITFVPDNVLLDDHNCTTFFVYYDGLTSNDNSAEDGIYFVNGSKFDTESITISPGSHFLSKYREKNIFVDEISVDVSTDDRNYTINYTSTQIDYTGEL